MKHTLLTSAALAFLSMPALAVTQDINLTATAAGACTISDSASPSALSQVLAVNPDGKVATTPVTLSFPVACNTPASLRLSSANGGLTGPAAATNYINRIKYTAATSGVFSATSIQSDGSAPVSATQTSGPASGTMTVTVTPIAEGILASGTYADTLRLTIAPLQ